MSESGFSTANNTVENDASDRLDVLVDFEQDQPRAENVVAACAQRIREVLKEFFPQADDAVAEHSGYRVSRHMHEAVTMVAEQNQLIGEHSAGVGVSHDATDLAVRQMVESKPGHVVRVYSQTATPEDDLIFHLEFTNHDEVVARVQQYANLDLLPDLNQMRASKDLAGLRRIRGELHTCIHAIWNLWMFPQHPMDDTIAFAKMQIIATLGLLNQSDNDVFNRRLDADTGGTAYGIYRIGSLNRSLSACNTTDLFNLCSQPVIGVLASMHITKQLIMPDMGEGNAAEMLECGGVHHGDGRLHKHMLHVLVNKIWWAISMLESHEMQHRPQLDLGKVLPLTITRMFGCVLDTELLVEQEAVDSGNLPKKSSSNNKYSDIYQNLYLYVVEALYKRRFKKFNDDVYMEILTDAGHHTRRYKKYQTIEQFASSCLDNKDANLRIWQQMMYTSDLRSKVISAVKKMDDRQFPSVKQARVKKSYENGVLDAGTLNFYDFEKHRYLIPADTMTSAYFKGCTFNRAHLGPYFGLVRTVRVADAFKNLFANPNNVDECKLAQCDFMKILRQDLGDILYREGGYSNQLEPVETVVGHLTNLTHGRTLDYIQVYSQRCIEEIRIVSRQKNGHTDLMHREKRRRQQDDDDDDDDDDDNSDDGHMSKRFRFNQPVASNNQFAGRLKSKTFTHDAGVASNDIVVEEEGSVVEEEGSVVEEEGSVVEEEGSVVEEEGSVVEEEGSVVEEEGSVVEEENVEAEDSVVEEENVEAEGSVAEEEGSVAEEEDSVAEEEGSVAEEEGSVAEEEDSVAEEEDSVAEEENSVVEADDGVVEEEDTSDVEEEGSDVEVDDGDVEVDDGDVEGREGFVEDIADEEEEDDEGNLNGEGLEKMAGVLQQIDDVAEACGFGDDDATVEEIKKRCILEVFKTRLADAEIEAACAFHDWYDIPTPAFDTIPQTQEWVKEKCMELMIQLGRVLFPQGLHDRHHIAMFLYGLAGTGKSLIGDLVEKWFPGLTFKLSCDAQRLFAWQNAIGKFVMLATELSRNCGFDITTLQQLISMETITVNRKNEPNVHMEWDLPMIFAGNTFFEGDKGAIARRILIFNFNKTVKNHNPALAGNIEKENGKLVVKCARGYMERMYSYNRPAMRMAFSGDFTMFDRCGQDPLAEMEMFSSIQEDVCGHGFTMLAALHLSGSLALSQLERCAQRGIFTVLREKVGYPLAKDIWDIVPPVFHDTTLLMTRQLSPVCDFIHSTFQKAKGPQVATSIEEAVELNQRVSLFQINSLWKAHISQPHNGISQKNIKPTLTTTDVMLEFINSLGVHFETPKDSVPFAWPVRCTLPDFGLYPFTDEAALDMQE